LFIIWTVIIHRIKEVLVRRITVKKAILNLRLAERYLCDINSSAALKNFKSVCKYEAILSANDLWPEKNRFVAPMIAGIFTHSPQASLSVKRRENLILPHLPDALFCFRKVCDFYPFKFYST
jgi:hypothetical protein